MKVLRIIFAVAIGAAVIIALIGCSASTQQSTNHRSLRPSGPQRKPSVRGGAGEVQATGNANAEQVDYYGWDALKLTNGLVSVIAVPQAGGRIMEYNLGRHKFLWVNNEELGSSTQATAPEGENEDSDWHNYGGYKVWPAPQNKWGGPPDPEGSQLDSGEWSGEITTASGKTATIEMTSPEDPQVTGLQIVRRISLDVNSTKLTIKETYRNVSDRKISWGVWGITQVPGYVSGNEKPSTDAQVFLPLNPNSQRANGYFHLMDAGHNQFSKVAKDKILKVSYNGKQSKIGADATAGWIAYVDNEREFALVQRFQTYPNAEYPDNGSIVQVYTSPSDLCYMEVEVNSPIRQLAPEQEYSFSQQWYCTRIGGPITKTTSAGAIRKHPTASKRGDKLVFKGEVGVFAPGKLAVEFRDNDGNPLDRSNPVTVSPAQKTAQRIATKPPKKAHSAMLILSDSDGKTKIGNIAEIPLGSKLAKASAQNKGDGKKTEDKPNKNEQTEKQQQAADEAEAE